MFDLKTEVFCSLAVEGTHNWPECPFEEVAYLRDPHRHVFHIKAYKEVTHNDREVEFIILKHKIQDYFVDTYYTDKNLCVFGSKSCEMIATELIKEFKLSRCEVSEDNENGAIVTVFERSPL